MYRAVPAQIDLPAMEHEVLALWDAEHVFERSIEQSAGRPHWVFYEGPPTANGRPGTHHVEARVFKDIVPRYRTMQGYYVPRSSLSRRNLDSPASRTSSVTAWPSSTPNAETPCFVTWTNSPR